MGVWIKKREGLWLALVLMMALAVALWPMPKRTFAFGDPGVRLLFIQSLLQSDSFIALDTRYPALEIDPQQLFAPSVWFVRLGERNLPHYPLLFCFASAFFYWLFGALGLYVVPFLSGLGIGLWVYWISRRVAPRWAAPAAFLAVFASPVVVFSVEFWDHTPSTLLMLGALYAWISGVERRRERQLLVAGLCAGLAVAVRTEFYVLVLLLPLAGWWIWRPKWRQIGCYVLGAFLPLALLWLSNTLIYGSPLGAHLLTHVPTSARNLLGWYRSGRRDLLAYFLPGAAGRVDDVLYGLGALLAGLSLWRPRQLVGTGLGRAIAWLATLWLVCIGLWAGGYLLSVTPVPDIGRVFPLVFALLAGTIYMRLAISIPPDIAAKQGMTDQPGLEPGVHGDDGASRQNRFLALVAAGFALLLLAFSLSPIGDLQWGARYFLPLYPIVMALSAAVWERLFASPPSRLRRAMVVAIALIGVLSAGTQSVGWRIFYGNKLIHEQAIRLIEASPAEAVVAEAWWMPQVYASIYYQRLFLTWNEQADDATLQSVLDRSRARQLVTISTTFPGAPPGSRIPLDEARWQLTSRATIASWIVLRFYAIR